MSGILGKKLGMTRVFEDDGRVIPITVVKCEPNEVTQVKTVEKDGYPAIVLGFSKLRKPSKTRKFYHMKEFKVEEEQLENYKKGDMVTLETLTETEQVEITSVSKGKGFQGVIKKYNFGRGPESHGSHHHREPGSVGSCAKPGRVHRGKKLPSRMGNKQVTLKKVKVAYIDPKNNIIGLKGALPGAIGALITIKI